MSVTTTSNRVVAVGDNSTTVFAFNRLLYDADHLEVYLDGVVQTSGYTVGGVPGTSTSVTFTTPPGTGVQVLMLRVVPLTQLSVYAVGGAFPASTTEKNLDLLMMGLQQFDEILDRAITLPVDSTLTAASIPDPGDPANYGLGLKIATDGSGLDTFSLSATPFTSPLTTKGDLAVFSTVADRLAVGANNTLLQADSAQARGVKYSSVLTSCTVAADPTTALGIASKQYVDSLSKIQDFRLSLTTAVPVTTSDVTGAGTLYAVPYHGNHLALYDGAAWNIRASSQFSLALTLTSGKPYDVFCYDNAGVPTLEVLVWTNDTTRATALVYQDGVLVKSGATTRRYLGSLYATGANVTEDSFAKRDLYNYYHRMNRPLRVVETTNAWTYSSATYQQANASAANQVEAMIGYAEDMIEVRVVSQSNNNTATITCGVGVGVDSTSVNSAQIMLGGLSVGNTVFPGPGYAVSAEYQDVPVAGRHRYVWLEAVTATGTTTWYGDNGATFIQSGITGIVRG